MILTESNKFEQCPAGSYLARCTQLVDLGTQTSVFQGKENKARKVMIGFEILDSEAVKQDGSHFVLSKRFTQSLNEKSALRPALVGWRGREFTPDELKQFNLKNILGQNALVNIVLVQKDDKTFCNIQSITRQPKNMQATVKTTEPLTFLDMTDDRPDWTSLDKFGAKLIDQICASPEFLSHPHKPSWFTSGTPSQQAPSRQTAQQPPSRAQVQHATQPPDDIPLEDFDSDIPF